MSLLIWTPALAHPAHQLVLHPLGAHGKDEDIDAGAAVGSLVRRDHPLDARLAATGDDGCGKARGHLGRRQCPTLVDGGDDQPRAPHLERLGEGILDFHAVDLHPIPPWI